MALSSKAVFPVIFILLALSAPSCGQNQVVSEKIKNIFLLNPFNSSEIEWMLASARESYDLLKSFEKQPADDAKLNFVRSYANFLSKLLKRLRTEEIDVHQIFLEENSFLKGYNSSDDSEEFNTMELKSEIENLQIIVEEHLRTYRNTSKAHYDVVDVLALNKMSFNIFLKKKQGEDYSEIGYFFLEVFATLIGLSWGIISTVLHVAHPMNV